MASERELSGRVAWITGGVTGMGRATALELARLGADVAVGSLAHGQRRTVIADQVCFTPEEHRFEAVRQEIEAEGVRALSLPLDVCDAASVQQSYDAIVARLGKIDILVNAAGSSSRKPLADHPDEIWQRMLDVNLTSAYRTIRLCFPGMAERRWGRIVNFASTAANVGYPLHSAYCAAKSALLGLTRSVGLEGAPYGITCNAINPGFVATEQNLSASAQEVAIHGLNLTPEQYRERQAEQLPQKRYLAPEEVGALAAFLCREDSLGIEGADITIAMGSQW